MKEYIERAVVLNLLEKINPVDFGSIFNYEMHNGVRECLREIRHGVEEIPATDVMEVQHGHWEFPIFEEGDINDPRCKCSICGSIETPLARHKFCPNCGARMDLKEY